MPLALEEWTTCPDWNASKNSSKSTCILQMEEHRRLRDIRRDLRLKLSLASPGGRNGIHRRLRTAYVIEKGLDGLRDIGF